MQLTKFQRFVIPRSCLIDLHLYGTQVFEFP